MALTKLLPKTDPLNKSGLDLSYHMVHFFVMDKKEGKAVCKILSFVDREQRKTSIKGGFEVLPPYIFSEEDFSVLNNSSNKFETLYNYVKRSLIDKDKKETNFLAGAKDDLRR